MGFADYLNVQSGYFIDWNRVGNLFFSNHRYSNKELIERSFIVLSTAVSGYLSWTLTDSYGRAALGLLTGFAVSHVLVILPLIQKRMEAQAACKNIISQLNNQFPDGHALSQSISNVTTEIMNHVSSKSSSEIWGKRKRLLSTLLEWTKDQTGLKDLLQDADIISHLDQGQWPLQERVSVTYKPG